MTASINYLFKCSLITYINMGSVHESYLALIPDSTSFGRYKCFKKGSERHEENFMVDCSYSSSIRYIIHDRTICSIIWGTSNIWVRYNWLSTLGNRSIQEERVIQYLS